MAVVAADRQYRLVPVTIAAEYLDDLEDVVRHNPDHARGRPARRVAPMSPVARQIVRSPWVGTNFMAHEPAAPGAWAPVSIGVGPLVASGVARARGLGLCRLRSAPAPLLRLLRRLDVMMMLGLRWGRPKDV